jgi:hypothetical protein
MKKELENVIEDDFEVTVTLRLGGREMARIFRLNGDGNVMCAIDATFDGGIVSRINNQIKVFKDTYGG